MLAFVAGKFDMTFPTEMTPALLKDVKAQEPNAICEIAPTNVSTNLIINREKPPFNNTEFRKAMALALDRKSFIDILYQGQADVGGTMLPPPEGVWGMPPEMLRTIPGYGDVKKDREQARKIMEKLGYGPDKPLKIKVSTRNIAIYRDPAVILIDQLKKIYIDGELEPVEIESLVRQGRAQGLFRRPQPDRRRHRRSRSSLLRELRLQLGAQLHALLQQGSGSLFDKQSEETDVEKRKKMVWEIEKKLQEDVARPIIMHARRAPAGSRTSRT